MGKYWVLDAGRKPVRAELQEWGRYFESNDRIVAKTGISIGSVTVSTVFLGIDHGNGKGPPLLFETMIFGGKHDGWQDRCSTWDEAVAMHQRAVDLAQRD